MADLRASQPFPPPTRRALEAILAELANMEGIRNVTIIDRIGAPMASHGPTPPDSETLHILAGTLSGVGQLALEALEHDPDVRVLAQSDHTRVHICGIDQEHLLVTVADNVRPWSAIRPAVNSTRKELRERIAAMRSA